MLRGLTVLLASAFLLAAGSGCRDREPCRTLAERDCARHGLDSLICRDARRLAAAADPYLVEVCRHVLETGSR